jgi:hypothetical protein
MNTVAAGAESGHPILHLNTAQFSELYEASASFPLPPRCLQLIRVVPTGQKSIPYGVRSGCLDSRLIMIISYYSFSVLTPGLVGLRAGPEPETAWSKSTRANPGLVMQPPARDKA